MCGIFGYIGQKNSVDVVIEGLKRLEYRGYDSAGIAGLQQDKVVYSKEAGKVAVLEQKVENQGLKLDIAIAHTRWATHGSPTTYNAHPHFDENQTLALVHNGIIENHNDIRRELKNNGVALASETDTEVVAHLISEYYDGDLLSALQKVISLIKGSFAIALVHRDFPGQIFVMTHDSPVVIGVGDGETFVSSDAQAFSKHTRRAIFLQSGDIAKISSDEVVIYDGSLNQVKREIETLDETQSHTSKGKFEHFTLKEIFEQPQTLRNALFSRVIEESGTVYFEEVDFDVNELLGIERILILGCGTSWHAGCVAQYLIEDMARIPVQVEISSEFRYKNPIVLPGTFVIAISQSGETADTLAALRELKAKGAHILSLCNVYGSTMVRESDSTIFLRAGPEIGVCSTKAFTSQVVILTAFTLMLGLMRHMSKSEGRNFVRDMNSLPEIAEEILESHKQIQDIAKRYAHYENFFFLGRQYMYPVSLEGALKLKEISYINANGYPAGEMKHGPIALINEDCPTVALCCNELTYKKMLSNLREVKARDGKVIAIANPSQKEVAEIVDETIWIPKTSDRLAAIPTSIVTQLLAYYIANERGAEIDQPRNLAKSVTVE